MSERASGTAALTVTIHARQGPAAGGPERWYLLCIEEGSSSIFYLPESGEVIIGRAPEAGLRLRDPSASRNHARLSVGPEGATLADLSSHNGTSVNGERITAARPLHSGDVISICDVTLIFHCQARAHLQRPIYEDLSQLRQRLEEEIERALSFHRPASLLGLHLGQQAGAGETTGRADQIDPAERPRVAEALAGQIRLMDVVAWDGPGQLLVLLPDRDEREAEEAAARLLKALHERFPRARAGCATCPSDGTDADTLLGGTRAALGMARPGTVLPAAAAVTTVQLTGRVVVVADPAMMRLYTLIERLAGSDLPVLVCGETGTGKELAAQAIHARSPRSKGPLVSLNCAALPETLAESELFGHERGAFTGADRSRPGILEAADGGTVFLDEIGELSPAVQAKLLRALDTKRLVRVGDVKERSIDIRVVAATNRDLEKEATAGRFRQDLFFRLSGAVLMLPPLRNRQRELPILARAFLMEACARLGREPMIISPAAMGRLLLHGWPGNVRELRNAMDYAAATSSEPVLEPWHLPERLAGPPPTAGAARPPEEQNALQKVARAVLRMSVPSKLDALEEALIDEAMALARDNKSAAARLLGVHRKVIDRRRERHERKG